MKIDSIALAALLLFGVVTHATAFAPDGCEPHPKAIIDDLIRRWN